MFGLEWLCACELDVSVVVVVVCGVVWLLIVFMEFGRGRSPAVRWSNWRVVGGGRGYW